MKRREFVQASLLTLGSTMIPTFFSRLAMAEVAATRHLVYVFLRGGADALSLVQPTAGAALTNLKTWRPDLAMPAPRAFSSGITLHPSLAPLATGTMAANFNVILNAGSINQTRSHFEQQSIIECGNSSQIKTDGFMARAAMMKNVRGIGVSTSLPDALRGAGGNAIVLADPSQLSPSFSRGAIKTGLTRVERMGQYQNAAGETGNATVHNVATVAQRQYDLLASQFKPEDTGDSLATAGGYYIASNQPPTMLAQRLAVTAALIGSSAAPGFLMVEADQGWDTHANQYSNDLNKWGSFAGKVDDLAKNLLAFRNDLVGRGKWNNTVVVVMSEFGRTVKQNGTGGSDHGRGGVMFVMGGNVRPHSDTLYTGPRSLTLPSSVDSSTALDVKIDQRAVMAEILEKHMQIPQASVLGASGLFYGQLTSASYLNLLKA